MVRVIMCVYYLWRLKYACRPYHVHKPCQSPGTPAQPFRMIAKVMLDLALKTCVEATRGPAAAYGSPRMTLQRSTGMSYLGIDIGTTGCKAVAFDERGRQLASAYREYTVLSPGDGWAELDSAQVCENCLAVISEAARACESDPVRALGVSSQGEAFTPVGAGGEYLANAMVSSDTRAARIASEWSESFGRERLYRVTGHTAHPMFTLFKLIWLRDSRPDVWERAAAFHCFEDLLHRRLGVEPAMSWPLAGRTMLFDIREHRWDPGILDAAGIDPLRLPRTLAAGEVVGEIPAGAARGLGLAEGAIVVAGGHDQPCGALGAGVIEPGTAVYATGTVECITPAFSAAVMGEKLFRSNLCTYDYTIRGMYTTVAFSLTGGNLLKWFRDEIGHPAVWQSEGVNPYEILIDSMPDEPTGLMSLPYFTPSGTPHFDVGTPGAVVGLRLTTTREELLRALLEGVAFEMRVNLAILADSGIPVNELIAIGGGARSLKWLQLKADVLGKPIRRAAVTEAGCLGAAMLARAADTGEDVRDLANKWVRVTDEVRPRSEAADFYDRHFPAYLRLYPAIKAYMEDVSGRA